MDKYVLYVDVENLSKESAEAYIKSARTRIEDFLGPDCKLLVIASKENRLEKL